MRHNRIAAAVHDEHRCCRRAQLVVEGVFDQELTQVLLHALDQFRRWHRQVDRRQVERQCRSTSGDVNRRCQRINPAEIEDRVRNQGLPIGAEQCRSHPGEVDLFELQVICTLSRTEEPLEGLQAETSIGLVRPAERYRPAEKLERIGRAVVQQRLAYVGGTIRGKPRREVRARRLAEYGDRFLLGAERRAILHHPVQGAFHILRHLAPTRPVALDVAVLVTDQAVERREDDEAPFGELRHTGFKPAEREPAVLPGTAV